MLEAREVTFGYSTSEPLLTGWSAQFLPGSMTAITGPSGRGKSTLLYLLGLMLRPTSGAVLVDGVSVSGDSDFARARMRANRFGFVFQDAALDSNRTVLANVTEVALYLGQKRSRVEPDARYLLEKFGVDVPPDRKPGQVSGGQAQRIALCRALLFKPDILLADEPTGNLDPDTAHTVVEALREHANSGSTVIIVTHTPDVATMCDLELAL